MTTLRGIGAGTLTDEELLVLAIALVKERGCDDRSFMREVARAFEALRLRRILPSRRSTDSPSSR